MELKSRNPFLKNKAFEKTTYIFDAEGKPAQVLGTSDVMTASGAIDKSILLFVLLLLGALTSVYVMLTQEVNVYTITVTAAITAFVLILIAGFKPQHSGIIAPAYALLQGVFVGGLSLIMEILYPGIVLQGVGATLVTFVVCFLLYRFKIVKVTEQFKSVLIGATMAVGTYYLISLALSYFAGIQLFHHSNSLMSIGFSVFVVILAALNLFMDFDFIEKGEQNKLPKHMEWFGAMGLIITLVWLYIEFLRLLSKISGRD